MILATVHLHVHSLPHTVMHLERRVGHGGFVVLLERLAGGAAAPPPALATARARIVSAVPSAARVELIMVEIVIWHLSARPLCVLRRLVRTATLRKTVHLGILVLVMGGGEHLSLLILEVLWV